MTEGEAMTRALDLAWRGWGRVHPNPMVGAVVLREGRVVAEGWHAEFGHPHAEAAALAAAGASARGATLVVTLEPCAHVGKQPPCVEAILGAGVARVVVGAADPNPAAAGGAARLAEAGVDVALQAHPGPVRDQNPAFFHAHAGSGRPFVALKLAISMDGMIADPAGRARWVSGEEARAYVHWLRAGFDAIGVGGRTARVDDPLLTPRGSPVPRVPPRRVVFSRRADLAPGSRLVVGAREVPTLVVAEVADPVRAAPLRERGVELVAATSLADGLGALRERGIVSLLVEGGGRLAGALLAAGLVDRFYWIQCPVLLGTGGVPAFAGLPGGALDAAPRWRPVERRPLGRDTLLVLDRGSTA